MKLPKTETEKELTVDRILHAKRCSLTLDKIGCTGAESAWKSAPGKPLKSEESLKQMEKKACVERGDLECLKNRE